MSSRHFPLLFHLLPLLCSAGILTASRPQCFSLNASFSFPAWGLSADCCTWAGVVCDPLTGRITGLDLSNRSISGSVGASLFQLTSLRTLNLAYNLFDEIPIPSGFENLRNLTHLNLSNSGFSGQIPVGIARLTKLVSLDLSTFYLNEAANLSLKLDDPDLATLLSNLTNLRELYLDGVNISKSGTEWCGTLASSVPGLTSLSLTGCSIARPIDSRLSKISGLSVVRLDQNQLNCSVPDFFVNFTSLRVLRLSSCGLRGVFPKSIFGLSNLTDLELSSNPMLSGTLPDFPEGSRVEYLVIKETNFSGQLPDSIGKMKFLSRLDLSSSRFSGQIPASIGKLTQLISLDLSMNKFSGRIPFAMPPGVSDLSFAHNALNESIPSSFGMLLNLTKVDLSNNSLSGSIPASLFALPSLQQLELNLNQLSGGIDFWNASDQLGIVDLSNNVLAGEIPKSVSKLSGVKILTLAWNNFSGIVELDWFRNLKELSSLDLSYNRLTVQGGDGNSSLSFPAISTLKLASCNLTQVPSFLKSQDQMTYLDLSNNRIGGAIPNWIWKSMNLNYLNLSLNSFTFVDGPLPNFSMTSTINLDLHSNLLQGPIPLPPTNPIILDYSNNLFTSSIPSNISSYLSFTVFFSLANNSIVGEIPSSICSATYLKVLDFSDNNLSGLIPPCIFQAGNDLRVLNLRNNKLRSIIPQNISKGCVLKTIDLNGNRLEGEVPSSLANCSTLEVLDLGNNRIVGSFPFWLDSISSLRVLVLRSNKLHGPLVAPPTDDVTSCSFPVLQIIDLSSNHFSGNLPSEFFKNLKGMTISSAQNWSTVEYEYMQLSASYYQDTVTVAVKGMDLDLVKILTIFTSIDLSNNSFVGEIPKEIVNFSSLIVLNLSHNALTGQIPRLIGNLSQLESMDLSVNHLSGEIPQEVTLLTFLSFLNLSRNNLVGRIPLGSQLSTFSSTSYQDNQGLCGSPLSKQCSSPSAAEAPWVSSTATEVNWQFIFIGFGYGGGLAVVVGLIMVWDTGKKWYNRKLDWLLWAVLPPSFWRLCDYFGDRRVGAEEGESVEMERWPSRSFCVFCTTLIFYEDRLVLHHVECDCSRKGEY